MWALTVFHIVHFGLVILVGKAHLSAREVTVHEDKSRAGPRVRNIMPRFERTWSELHVLGTNRLLHTTYFWIVFIPVVAKLLSNVEDVGTFRVFGFDFVLNLSLPFPWTVFFYGSVLAVIANVVYLFCCPNVLQQFPNYAAFNKAGATADQLSAMFAEALSDYEKEVAPNDLRNAVRSFCTDHCSPGSFDPAQFDSIPRNPWQAKLIVAGAKILEPQLANALWTVQQFVERQSKLARRLCLVLYSCAILCFLFVFIKNILFVVNWHLG